MGGCMNFRPHMLPKVRSEVLMDAIGGKLNGRPSTGPMPCTPRISGLVAGHRCASSETVVGAHLGNLGKGMSTKVSDLNVVAACLHCHNLIDGVDSRWWWLMENPCFTTMQRLLTAQHETQAMLLDLGIISVLGAEII